jgi:hypothetical protein
MRLEEINTILHIQSGAPVPVVLSDEYKLILLYYYNKILSDRITSEMPVERKSKEDKGIASLSFKNHLIYKFGYPNAEVLQSHPYYNLVLESYNVYEVKESDWLKQIEDMNKVHPFHNPIRFKMYKHFVITFEDSTFECIARELELNFFQNFTMQDALKSVSDSFVK